MKVLDNLVNVISKIMSVHKGYYANPKNAFCVIAFWF